VPSTERGLRLIAGLGNPGREYARTRHNAGFRVIDVLAERWNVALKPEPKWRAEVGRAGDVFLCKPTTFMNLSGEAVSAIADYYKIQPEETLIVCDDAALPLGRIRLRLGGSSGGQNGLANVILHFATENVPRLRIGVGGPEGRTLTSHVLGAFSPDEETIFQAALTRAADAVELAEARGLESAMNQFNQANQ
jgi:PTH1 family peptidyl-tRNA hydrolase